MRSRLLWVQQNRCSVLLTALCLMILLAPAMGGSRLGTTLLSLATTVVCSGVVSAARILDRVAPSRRSRDLGVGGAVQRYRPDAG